jgi:hypothetical protein
MVTATISSISEKPRLREGREFIGVSWVGRRRYWLGSLKMIAVDV